MKDATISKNIGRFGPMLVRPCRFSLILGVGRFSEHILRNQNLIIGLGSYSRQLIIYLDPILMYISL